MKKLFVLLTSTLLFACSSGPSLDQLAAQMPKDNRSVMLQVPEAGNPVSNGMLVATIRTAGGTSGKRLASDRKSTRLNSSHNNQTRMPSSA